MRDPEGVVLRIVEGEDLVLRLLDQDVQPNGQVRADHVHQAETRDNAVTVNLHLLERDVLLLFLFFYFIVLFCFILLLGIFIIRNVLLLEIYY